MFFTQLSSNHSWSCGQNKVHFIRANKRRFERKQSSCSDQGNNPTAPSAWLFSSICYNRKTLNRPSSAVLTDNVLIKTSLHMLRQLPKPITNDQLIILGPLFSPPTSSSQTNLGRMPVRHLHVLYAGCFALFWKLPLNPNSQNINLRQCVFLLSAAF